MEPDTETKEIMTTMMTNMSQTMLKEVESKTNSEVNSTKLEKMMLTTTGTTEGKILS